MIEKIKKTLEMVAAPITAIASVWGLDVSAIVAATAAFLVSAVTYVEFWVNRKKGK